MPMLKDGSWLLDDSETMPFGRRNTSTFNVLIDRAQKLWYDYLSKR